jgi:ribokinase
MAEVVVYGTAAADVVLRVPRLPTPGEHLQATALGWRLGGGAANVACGLAAAGHRVAFVGPIGNDAMAEALKGRIASCGIATEWLFRVTAASPRALILLDPRGERTILGVDHDLATRVYPLANPPSAPEGEGVYVETYARFPVAIAERAREALLVTAPPTSGAVRWPADVVIGSERQFPASWGADPFAAAHTVAGRRLRWVVVTRGDRGADAYGRRESLHVAAPVVRQVDATGAGDAFAAGLISGLLASSDIEEAMATATRMGAAAVASLASVPAAAIEAITGA